MRGTRERGKGVKNHQEEGERLASRKLVTVVHPRGLLHWQFQGSFQFFLFPFLHDKGRPLGPPLLQIAVVIFFRCKATGLP